MRVDAFRRRTTSGPPRRPTSGARRRAGRPTCPTPGCTCSSREEDLQKAKALIGNDNERAARPHLTEVARAEAQLALSLAKQAQADGQARQAQDELSKASREVTPAKRTTRDRTQ